jgi:hypothetical protein
MKIKKDSQIEIAKRTRKSWNIKPVTKIKDSDKKYNRKKDKENLKRNNYG